MNPQRNGDPRFRLTYVLQAKEHFRQIVRRARQLGRLADVIRALRSIQHRLRTDPREFGESTRLFRHARLDSRHAAVGSIVVYYGVHLDLPEVFVSGFTDML